MYIYCFFSFNNPSYPHKPVCPLLSGGRKWDGRGISEKRQQTGEEMAQRDLTYNDSQNIQDGSEGSGWGGGKEASHKALHTCHSNHVYDTYISNKKKKKCPVIFCNPPKTTIPRTPPLHTSSVDTTRNQFSTMQWLREIRVFKCL